MGGGEIMRRGMVLAPRVAAATEERLCVLLDDATAPQVRVQIAQRDANGQIVLTAQQFVIPVMDLGALRPIEGLRVEV